MLGVVNTECCYAECHGVNFFSSLLLQPSKLGRLQPNIGSTAMIGHSTYTRRSAKVPLGLAWAKDAKKMIQGYSSTWENPNTLAYFFKII